MLLFGLTRRVRSTSPRGVRDYPKIFLTYFLATRPTSAILARSWRLRFFVFGLFRCFLPAWLRFSRPVADDAKPLA